MEDTGGRVEPPLAATAAAALDNGKCRIERPFAVAVAVRITLPDDGELFTMDGEGGGPFFQPKNIF